MPEEHSANPPSEKLFMKAFLRGLLAAALIYALLGAWLWVSAPAALRQQQEKLAAQTVQIERPRPVYKEPFGPPRPQAAAEQLGPPAPAAERPPPPVLPPSLTTMESGLAAAPVEGLYETTADGRLPAIRKADGLTPFQAYRRLFDRFAADRPVISIAVVDLGLSDDATETAIRTLPPEISIGLSPYAKNPELWLNEARRRGHEVWMMLPLESETYPLDDMGPHTILISAPEKQNQMKLSWILSRATGYVGLIAGERPAFMKATGDMRPVLSKIYSRGLGFVDTSADPSAVPQSMALGQNAPYASADVWIDNPPTKENMDAAFARLESIAREQGSATGLIHPLPVSFQELSRWIETLPGKGLALAPLSAQTGL